MPFAKVQTESRELNQVQSNIQTALQPLQTNELLSGAFLNNVSLATGSNTLYHGLGRQMLGWFVTSRSNAATIYNTSMTDTSLVLVASGSVTVNIYVF